MQGLCSIGLWVYKLIRYWLVIVFILSSDWKTFTGSFNKWGKITCHMFYIRPCQIKAIFILQTPFEYVILHECSIKTTILYIYLGNFRWICKWYNYFILWFLMKYRNLSQWFKKSHFSLTSLRFPAMSVLNSVDVNTCGIRLSAMSFTTPSKCNILSPIKVSYDHCLSQKNKFSSLTIKENMFLVNYGIIFHPWTLKANMTCS